MELGDDVRRMCEKFYHVLTFPPHAVSFHSQERKIYSVFLFSVKARGGGTNKSLLEGRRKRKRKPLRK